MTASSPPPLEVEVPARAQELAAIRRRVSEWMTLVGISADLAADILLVVNEACSNSIEHAYLGKSEGTVRITAERAPDAICFTIEDFGRWRGGATDADVARGRGLPLMRALSARVDLSTSTGGTRLSMTFAPSA
ncbi:ATP-binding protein [Mycolicibacterium sediminis]|uniref:Histidine kinase/HSP90-like ATPase domain-containing protein n=1 Tax=Mycolicibacterium sediminis TaxID=1286180 RepID=A0A7I7QNP4_9MYCO|nr:ATP-binding protein [Mycolicibacterium sediminis]BBY27983.1 hypothetical protein MSEDJ_20790 [Mycolicibacterium sediminis]